MIALLAGLTALVTAVATLIQAEQCHKRLAALEERERLRAIVARGFAHFDEGKR